MQMIVLQERRPGSPYEQMLVPAIAGSASLTFFGVIYLTIMAIGTVLFSWRWWEDKRSWLPLLICWGAMHLILLCTLICKWFHDLGVCRRFGPLDVRLLQQIVQGKPFTLRIEREVRKPIVIDRLDASLMLIEQTLGQTSGDGSPDAPYLDEREVWSMTQPYLEKKTLPTGGVIKSELEFVMPDEHPLKQAAHQRHESEESARAAVGDVEEQRNFFWQIRLKTCLSDGFVSHADFVLPLDSDKKGLDPK